MFTRFSTIEKVKNRNQNTAYVLKLPGLHLVVTKHVMIPLTSHTYQYEKTQHTGLGSTQHLDATLHYYKIPNS